MEYNIIKKIYEVAGFAEFFRTDPNAMNICGIRAYYDSNNTPGIYNDCIAVAWLDESQNPMCQEFLASTDPGLITYEEACNKDGVACLMDGYLYWYYLSDRVATYFDRNSGRFLKMKYPCMRHYGANVPVTRDTNFDGVQDTIVASQGQGILIHYGGEKTVYVGKWSQGCQVIPSIDNYEVFINLMSANKATATTYGYQKEVPYLLIDIRKFDQAILAQDDKTIVEMPSIPDMGTNTIIHDTDILPQLKDNFFS
jgi:hypothetical protein